MDSSGNCKTAFDYLPFGEELYAGVNGRPTSSSCFSAAPDAGILFTSKERDAETGLDFFGARYFSSAQGRFTTPDWSAKPQPVPYARLEDPQTLNLYAYVRNNPLSRIDPDGHIDCTGKNAAGAGCQFIANWNAEHGISPSAKRQDPPAPGVAVTLPNGKTVNNPYTSGALMSPTSDLSNVAARGRDIRQKAILYAGWAQDLSGASTLLVLKQELQKAVAQNGDFDYQRVTLAAGQLQQLPQFRDVSNFNVGLVGQQAGLNLDTLLQIVGYYAKGNSSNARPDQPYGLDPRTRDLTILGFQTGESGVYGH